MRWIGVLLTLLIVSPADPAPNVVIICSQSSWVPTFSPLESWLENGDYDYEGSRPWRVEVVTRSDSSSVKSYLNTTWSALQQQGGGDLFAIYAVDPSFVAYPVARMIYDPEVAGADIGWGDYVASYDNFVDLNGDGLVEAMTQESSDASGLDRLFCI